MNGAKLIKYFEDMKAIRLPLESHIKQCFQYSFPVRGVLFGSNLDQSPEEVQNAANALQAALFDGTATDGCTTLASTLISNMTPANSIWFGVQISDKDDAEVKKWLSKIVEETHQGIHASNFDAPAFESLLDVTASGMCALYIEEGDDNDFLFDAWPLSHCWFGSSKRGGAIDIVYFQFGLTALQAIKEYGSRCPQKIIDDSAKNPYKRWQFVQAIMPRESSPGKKQSTRDQLQPYVSKHVSLDTKTICRTKGYYEFPVAAPRWMKLPNSVYAQGPMSLALPDSKTLNEAKRLVLANADMQISGMWGATNDGVINPKTTKIGPRKIIFMEKKDNFFPITPPGRPEIADFVAKDAKEGIRRILMSDQMQPMSEGPARTAAEWHYRMQLLRQLLGPMFGRLTHEFLQRIVFRCIGIKIRKEMAQGNMPPDQVRDKVLRLKYISPLARAQRTEEVASMDRFEAGILQKAPLLPNLLDLYDWEGAERKRSEALGVPGELVLDVKKTEEARKVREDRMAKQQQAEAPAPSAAPTGQVQPAIEGAV